MKLRNLWALPTPLAPAMMREQLAMLDAGETFDPDAYNRQLREDRQEVMWWVMLRVLVLLTLIVWGAAMLSAIGRLRLVQGQSAVPGSCERHANSTRRSSPTPSDTVARLGPVPSYRFGVGVLQLYTASDRRSALIEASDLRTTLAQHGGQAWAVRVTVVPWWANRWTVIVPDVQPYVADELCDWFGAFGRPQMPPPAPNRASGRKTCRRFQGPWPMEKPPAEEDQ